eukprot:2469799-Ditylum_brightwellii.AAC.1
MVSVVEVEEVMVDVKVGTEVAQVVAGAVDVKDKANMPWKTTGDNKCKMAAATSDTREEDDNNQAENAMNCKKRPGKQG